MTDPQVVIGNDRLQTETSHASTVESFFLQEVVPSENLETDTVTAVQKKRGSSMYAFSSSDTFSVRNTLEVFNKIKAQISLPEQNQQDGATIENKKTIVDLLLSDAVCCGYMEQFAQRTFCSENLAFVMAVEMYKAVWLHMDLAANSRVAAENKKKKEILQKPTTPKNQYVPKKDVSSVEEYSTSRDNSRDNDGSDLEPRSSNLTAGHSGATNETPSSNFGKLAVIFM
jgi:hypothetical protein